MPITVKVIDIIKIYYSDFPKCFTPTNSYLRGISRVFNHTNEPYGDSYARSPVATYVQNYKLVYEQPDGERKFMLFEENPWVNINDVIVINKNSKNNYRLEIVENLTQKELLQQFCAQYNALYDKANLFHDEKLGLVLHTSHDTHIYMPGYGNSAEYNDTHRGMYSVSLSPVPEIIVADKCQNTRLGRTTAYGANFVVPGDVVGIPIVGKCRIGKVITNLIHNNQTR